MNLSAELKALVVSAEKDARCLMSKTGEQTPASDALWTLATKLRKLSAQAASTPDLPPPFDSQEEAQRAAGIWPQEAEPATVRVKPSALDEMAAQAASWRVGVDLARDGADAMAYMLRSARKPAPAPTGIDATLAERGSRYGKFVDHAAITMKLKDALRQRIYENTTKFQADQLEAIDMICHKLGRIVNGDPNYADSWLDIAGYAKLVADRLEGVSR